jgi:hypothetical protein
MLPKFYNTSDYSSRKCSGGRIDPKYTDRENTANKTKLYKHPKK